MTHYDNNFDVKPATNIIQQEIDMKKSQFSSRNLSAFGHKMNWLQTEPSNSNFLEYLDSAKKLFNSPQPRVERINTESDLDLATFG